MTGAVAAIIGAFPVAALCALVFRFPIPLAGYQSGPTAVLPSLFAVVFYGVFGGFIVLGGAGAIGGVIVYRAAKGDRRQLRKYLPGIALLVDVVTVGVLSTLDKVIGPW